MSNAEEIRAESGRAPGPAALATRILVAGRLESHPRLKPRERVVLSERVLGKTLDSVAKALGITREGVRQLQVRGLVRLRGADGPLAELASGWILFSKNAGIMAARKARASLRRRVKASLKVEFDRTFLEPLVGADRSVPDLELCRLLYEEFEVRWFFKYCRCPKCGDFAPVQEFPPKVRRLAAPMQCTACNAQRARDYFRRNGRDPTKFTWFKKNRGKVALYQRRHAAKKRGQPVPPLPKPGEIVPEPTPMDNSARMRALWASFSPQERAEFVERRKRIRRAKMEQGRGGSKPQLV